MAAALLMHLHVLVDVEVDEGAERVLEHVHEEEEQVGDGQAQQVDGGRVHLDAPLREDEDGQ